MSITHAYCVELDQEITIDEARRAYRSLPQPAPRFHFLCTSPDCRRKGVVITGVNYTFNAEDSPKHREAHYADRNSLESHASTCEWRILAEPIRGVATEDPARPHQHDIRRKLTDLVTHFDPFGPPDPVAPGIAEPHPARIRNPAAHRGPQPAGHKLNIRTETRDLERLVHTYREARERLSPDELENYYLNVKGIGSVRLVDYFRHLSRADECSSNTVIYGGSRLRHRYGAGFKMRFFDKIRDLPVDLYVSPALMDSYPHRRYLEGILNDIPSRRYVTAYVIGLLRIAPSGASFNLDITHLHHLALVLGPTLEQTETLE